MKGLDKVLQGVLKFRKSVRKDLVKQFDQLKNHPDALHPTALMFTCMDSRLLPSEFTQSRVGDMFVVRNSGNMVPAAKSYGSSGNEVSVNTEPAALELGVKRGNIHHVIVCGHSDCKAINTLYELDTNVVKFNEKSPMDRWLRRNGYDSLKKLKDRIKDGPEVALHFGNEQETLSFDAFIDPKDELHVEDKLSQINTLQQLLNIASHDFMEEYLIDHKVYLTAMWFDIYDANMYLFSKADKQFVMIDEQTAGLFLEQVKQEMSEVKENNHVKCLKWKPVSCCI
uniref:Carbonic anhydrase n=1 Tax=Rhabditophanes sp. KR3021 TaxID=114890 RepID=A0AC35UAJ6_9BILA